MAIETVEYGSINRLFGERPPYHVPPYQRAYAWEKEEVEDFCEDIKRLYESRINQKIKTHFFGGIISFQTLMPNTTKGMKYEVVDGQQRLATFTMTLAQIANSLEKLSELAKQAGLTELSDKAIYHANEIIRDQYIFYKDFIDNKKVTLTRLVLSKRDFKVFDDIIKNTNTYQGPKLKSHSRITKAFDTIYSILIKPIINDSQISLETKIEKVIDLTKTVLEDCILVHIVDRDRGEACQIFMVINDRGRSLSAGDLLRADTLKMLESFQQQQEEVEKLWDSMLEGDEKNTESFLRAYYPSITGRRAGKTTLYDDFRLKFFNYDTNIDQNQAEQIKTRVLHMKKQYELFKELLNADWPYEDSNLTLWKQNRLIRLIKILNHTLCLPLLMVACEKLQEEIFYQLINTLERFVFRNITICGEHVGPVSDIYYKFCVIIYENPQNFSIEELADELRRIQTSDKIFEEQLVENLEYVERGIQKILKHFFTTLEDYKNWVDNGANGKPRENTTTVYDFNVVSIEHIYPKNANVEDRDIDLERMKHSLGNLTFWGITDNNRRGNENFNSKKQYYATSNIAMNRHLSSINSWNLDELQRRQRYLVKIASKIFSV